MKPITDYIVILLALLLISSCKKQEEPAYTLDKLTGFVQKGPYINGTAIIVSELNNNLNPTGKTFSSQIFDNKGSFEVNEVELNSQYVEIRADGFYFDEIAGDKSTAQLTLFGLADISSHSTINVNILTQLEKSRVEYLFGIGLSFGEAKVQAQAEVLNAFGFEYEDMSSSELLDISQEDEDNAILLAISLILQSNRTVGDLTELIANISTDLKEDGILNSVTLKSRLVNQASYIDTIKVRENLETRYESMGVEATIPDFEKYLHYYLENENPIKISYAIKDISCNGQGDGGIDITMEGGTAPFIFQWSNGATTKDISNLSKGTYWVFITDSNNYKYYSNEISINEPDMLLVEVKEIKIPEGENNTGSIDISVSGGTLPYAIQWSNGSNTEDLMNLAYGGYTVIVIDSNDCNVSNYIPIIDTTYVIKDVTCKGSADGEIDLIIEGGTQPYSFQWSNGATSEDISNLSGGKYSVTVTDANNYEFVIKNINIYEPELLFNIVTKNVTCNGYNDGEINITIIGGCQPFNFQWSNGETTEDISSLSGGNYSVRVTDANNYEYNSGDINVYEPEILISIKEMISIIEGERPGSIDINVLGGTPPYTFVWSNGSTTEDIFNLSQGKYTITVTDANGCRQIKEYQVNENDYITDARDGQRYLIVHIGEHWWMAQNLNFYVDSESFYYDFDSLKYADFFGRLYTWDAAQNSCPPGWHVPSLEEFKSLYTLYDYELWSTSFIISNSQYGFEIPKNIVTNESGLSILLGGLTYDQYDDIIRFSSIGEAGLYLTSSYVSGAMGFGKGYITFLITGAFIESIGSSEKLHGYVRCVKD
jgi:uncharacterized protein (TIGR02145 family)